MNFYKLMARGTQVHVDLTVKITNSPLLVIYTNTVTCPSCDRSYDLEIRSRSPLSELSQALVQKNMHTKFGQFIDINSLES